MDKPKRHLHVADLTCIHCTEKDQEIERVREALRNYAESETKRAEELSGAYDTIRAQGKEITRLKRDLTRQAKESAKAEQIELVAEHWRYHRPKASSAFAKPGSKSYQVIEKAVGLMADDSVGPVKACMEAIDGLHIAPWQEYDRRFSRPGGPKRVLRNSVEHALGDEQRIAKCRAILRKFRNLGPERAYEVYTAVGETYWALGDEVMDLLGERPVKREAGEWATVDGIRTRVDK